MSVNLTDEVPVDKEKNDRKRNEMDIRKKENRRRNERHVRKKKIEIDIQNIITQL